MRRTLTILDSELDRLSRLIARIDSGKFTVQADGVDETATHREQLVLMLADFLEVRSRITGKLADLMDQRSKDIPAPFTLGLEAIRRDEH